MAADSQAGGAEMDEEGPAICWVCRDPDRPEPLVAPCRCRGSMRGVHASCIESWVAARSQQRLRPDLQERPATVETGVCRGAERGRVCVGGDHTQPRICCDLCGEPYQAEHHPAHLCDCLKAHLQSCWAELREEIRSIGLRWVCGMLLANCWLTCVMMGMAILVSGLINKACHANEKWQCGLAVFFYVAFLLTLICESLVILVSFPWTATPPGRCFVLRPFFLNTLHNQTMKAMVVLFWAHLWMVPFMSVVTCAGVEYTSSHLEKKEDVEVRCSWDLFALLCVPALLPHLKHGFVTLWGYRFGGEQIGVSAVRAMGAVGSATDEWGICRPCGRDDVCREALWARDANSRGLGPLLPASASGWNSALLKGAREGDPVLVREALDAGASTETRPVARAGGA
eukprot:g13913.t1